MITPMTKAELKRRLQPGTKLILVNSLMGPCNKPRKVHAVKSSEYIMETEEGRHSHLHIDSNEYVEATDNGFRIMNKENNCLMAEYIWG